MARRRTLGYIQNEWTCPNCNTRNKGGSKTCENCGAPQPENVQFELPSDQKFVSDENQIKVAQAGADIHCPFCGTRNPAAAEACSQCGGDLKEGKAREAGRIMQAPPPQPRSSSGTTAGTRTPAATPSARTAVRRCPGLRPSRRPLPSPGCSPPSRRPVKPRRQS